MPFWVLLLIFVAAIVIGELARPKLRDNARAATLKDFSFPTAEENRAIPVVWGTPRLEAPNVTWYGDLQSVKLTKKVRTGLFSTDRVTIGFRYAVGMELALCHGPLDSLLEIQTVDTETKTAWSGNITGSGANGTDFVVDNRTIFGGDSEEQLINGGEGGLYAACTFYNGGVAQTSNSYLSTILTTTNPAHRGVAYVVWKGPSSGNLVYNYDLGNPTIAFTREPFLSGYVGTSPNMKPLYFVVRRLPNLINPLYYNINNGDANPADVILELLLDDVWGMGLTTSYIDLPSFEYAQQKLFEEELGFTAVWDSPKKVGEVVSEVLSYIDGIIYTDLATGLLKIVLARDDYDPNNIVELNESNIVKVNSYSSGSIDETTNEVQLSYIDRHNKYKEKVTVAHDLANARQQDDVISSTVSYVGISNGTIASRIANRDVRQLSYPLDKISVTTDRVAIQLRPGSVFRLNFPELGITSKIFRAIRITFGEFENGLCEVDAIEDIFSLGASVYGDQDSGQWTPPDLSATTPTLFETIEAPYFHSGDSEKLIAMAARPDSGQLSFNTYVSIGSPTGTYAQIDSGDSFTPTATLDSSYSALTSAIDTGSLVVTPTSPDQLIFLQNFTADYIRTVGANLAMITDGTKVEFISFQNVSYDSGTGKYTLSNIWRGLLDTVPQSWQANDRIWFLDYGSSEPSQTFSAGNTVYTKVESVSSRSVSALSAYDTLVMNYRSSRPYPPGKFRINGSASTVNISNGSNITIDWEHRNRVDQDQTIVSQDDTGYNAEPRTSYYLKFYNATNTLLRTVGPLTMDTTTYTYLNADQVSDNSAVEPDVVTVHLYAERDGIYSLYPQQRTLIRPGGSPPSGTPYSPGADNYVPPLTTDATSINGIPVIGTPSDNDVLMYDLGTNSWVPSPVSSAITLGGDVTGPGLTNTVEKIRNRTVQATAPLDGQGLIWSASDNAWKPQNIGASATAQETVILTSYNSTPHSITANNVWTDINGASIAYSSTFLSTWQAVFTCTVAGTSADWEHLEFRMVLDSSTNGESWLKAKDVAPANSERLLLTMHTTFENLSPNSNHEVKVQWRDNGGKNLDVTFYDRRLTATIGKPSFDPNFAPDDIAELEYWFKANELILNNADPVDTLVDYSGNSRDFSAVTTNNRGTFATNQINSLPAVQFTHNGNGATTTNTQYNGPTFTTGYTAAEVFIVLKAEADPASSTLKGAYSTFGSDANVCHYPYTNGDIFDDFATTSRKNIPNASVPVSLASWNLYNVSSASGSWIARINGTQIYSTVTNTVGWVSTPIFGGSGAAAPSGAGFSGYIAEIMLFSKVLNATERLNVRAYVSNKYGV